jgi:hypothetical protein
MIRCATILCLAIFVSSEFLHAAAGAAHWNVEEAGAIPDGQTDCTQAFQTALDKAGAAGGGVVEVPAGKFRIATHLAIPANVTLKGIFRVPPTSGPSAPDKLTGSVLLAFEGRGKTNGPPFIRLAGNNAALEGLIIAYPEWKQTEVPPVPYPPCVFAQDVENTGISECCLLNPYEAITLIRAARHLVRNVTGYPIWRGIYVDECYDIGHIENVHFWPFGVAYNPEDPFCRWVNTQGTAFELARTDWHYVHNTFCFGYGIGYRFSESKTGSANGNFLGLGADSCQRAVVVDQAQPPGLLIVNGEFVGRWSSTNSICMEIGANVQGKVSLANCSFWGPIDRCVWMRAGSGQFTANACHFVDWDNGGIGSPAIQLDAGKAIIQASTFGRAKLHVSAGSNVISAILTANQAEGGLRIRNFAGSRLQAALNEMDNLEWSPADRLYYEILVGARGDGRYFENWYDPETVNGHWRWSRRSSRMLLPVERNKNYTIAIEGQIPERAVSPEAGLFLDGKRLAALAPGGGVSASLNSGDRDTLEVEVRCLGWVPKQVLAGSQDDRTLGIQLHRVLVRAEGQTGKPFDANTGRR